MPDTGELHQRHQPDHADRERHRRDIGKYRFGVFPEGHRGERHGRCETDGRRHPAGQKTESRMVGAAQEIIFAARARKHRAELAVGKYTAQRDQPADGPQQQNGKAGRDVLDLEAEAGEDPHAHHVGDNDRGRDDDRNRGPASEKPAWPRRASRF